MVQTIFVLRLGSTEDIAGGAMPEIASFLAVLPGVTALSRRRSAVLTTAMCRPAESPPRIRMTCARKHCILTRLLDSRDAHAVATYLSGTKLSSPSVLPMPMPAPTVELRYEMEGNEAAQARPQPGDGGAQRGAGR